MEIYSLAKKSDKSTKDVDFYREFKRYENMDNYTQEEALVQLIPRLKRQGYDVSDLEKFQKKYKNIIRWLRDPDQIIDPNSVIDYDSHTVDDISSKLYNQIKRKAEELSDREEPLYGYREID